MVPSPLVTHPRSYARRRRGGMAALRGPLGILAVLAGTAGAFAGAMAWAFSVPPMGG